MNQYDNPEFRNACVKLTIQLTEEYRERVNKAKAAEDLRKCRSWIDLLGANDDVAEVEINRNCIILKCNTHKGTAQESCTYDSVLALTEMKDGILLRLSHKRILFLPITDHPQDNERVMNAMMLMSEQCRYVFRTARLRLPGVSFKSRLRYHTRPRQGYYTGDSFTKGALIALICVSLFIGTVFTTQPFRNRKIEMNQAVAVSGIFEQADPAYGRGSLKYIDLEFRNTEEQTIDGCCVKQELGEKLEQIPVGTQMRLLVHPESDRVLQLEADGEILLDFHYAQEQLWKEAIGFMWLGLVMYAASAYLIVGMARKKL